MNNQPKKVFIYENDEYVEITYEEYQWHLEHDTTYKDRKFMTMHEMLMEVTPEDYDLFSHELVQQRYERRRSIRRQDVSLDGPLSEEINAFLVDPAADVNRIVEDRLMISKLRDTILSLRKDEQLLIIQYFYEEMTESRIAEMYGVTQQAISHRLKMLCRRLKEKLG